MSSTLTAAPPQDGAAPRIAPGPAGRGLGGSLPDFRADKIGFFIRTLEEHGPIARFRFGNKTIHLLWHPDHVKEVLAQRYLNFEKASRGYNKLKPLLGRGMVTADGSWWQRQRRIAQPSFHHRRITGLADAVVRVAVEFGAGWDRMAERGEALSLYPQMGLLAFTVVARALLGSDLSPRDFEIVSRGLATSLEHMNHNIYRLFDVPAFLPTRRNREFRAAVEAMDGVVYKIIAERRADRGEGRKDLLAMLMAARDEETGEGMGDEALRDEVMTMMLAGHETTAIALTWTWYLLSTHPTVRRRLTDELDRELAGRAPTADDVPRLPYLSAVIQEALRLYPPIWAFSRRAIEGFELGGYDIPAGSTLFLSPYVTHRHPEVWESPEGFDPDRFLPGAPEWPKYAWIPFGGGPRNCIGSGFALLEMQMVLATLLQRFQLDLHAGQRVGLHLLLTLRPSTDLPMVVTRRRGGGADAMQSTPSNQREPI